MANRTPISRGKHLLAHWFRQWYWVYCNFCEKRVGWGPRHALIRVHCRLRHGMALTLRRRVRRRQWYALAPHYALAKGASMPEWQASTDARMEKEGRHV